MIFHATPLAGVLLVECEPDADERGSFARTFCSETFAAHGLMSQIAQSSVSTNSRAGTLRGLHFQRPPFAECKLVRCTRGSLFDVAVDLRDGSPTYGRWTSTVLSAHGSLMIYVPEGCAHGFQTLEDDTEVAYDISVPYVSDAADGVRWDDPELAIGWPDAPGGRRVVSSRDAGFSRLAELEPIRDATGDRRSPTGR